MFKRIKINYTKGKLRQIRLFDIPIVQYEIITEKSKKKIRFCLPMFLRPKKDRPVFYLKINNTNTGFNIFCLQHWLNIINTLGGDFVIVCDNKKLEYVMLNRIIFCTSNIKIIRSDRTIPKRVIKNVATIMWEKAAYAHLTTFYHAKKYGIEEFWNIDADDTSFMEEPPVVANALQTVVNYAKENNLDAFSLDMHRTFFRGEHWSFGVAYIQNNSKLIKLVEKAKNRHWHDEKLKYDKNCNLDWYFTYLLDSKQAKISTFEIDNCYFMHWGAITNLLFMMHSASITRNKQMEYPLGYKMFNVKDSIMQIPDDCISFDTGIKEENSLKFWNNFTKWDASADKVFTD